MRFAYLLLLFLFASYAVGGEETPSRPKQPPLSQALRMVRAVAVSPDKSMIAIGRVDQIQLFQTSTGDSLRNLSCSTASEQVESARSASKSFLIESLSFSPDGKIVAAGGYQEIQLWDLAAGTVRRVAGFEDRVVALAFSPDGKLLATGGGTATANGEIKLIKVTTGDILPTLEKAGFVDTVYGVAFSPDGAKLAGGSADKSVRVFDVASGNSLKTFQGHIHHVLDVAWGIKLVSAGADGVLKVWDYESGEEVAKLSTMPVGNKKNPQPAITPKEFSRMSFAAGGTLLLTCGGDAAAHLWDIGKAEGKGGRGPVRTFTGSSTYCSAASISADGQRVAVGGEDGTARVYDGKTGDLVHQFAPPHSAP